MTEYNLEMAAHVVQLALTPVFLLSGTATLLGVFAARLARVADRVDTLAQEAKDPIRDELLALLRLRSHCLDVAVVLSALAGGLTCAAVLVLFVRRGHRADDGLSRRIRGGDAVRRTRRAPHGRPARRSFARLILVPYIIPVGSL